MILDIRTLSVTKDDDSRHKQDNCLREHIKRYDFVTAISEGVRTMLNLSPQRSSIVPLGADIISNTNKNFEQLKLVYIGTFDNRDIDKTIEGFAIFKNKNPEIKIHYDIIGSGCNNELETYQKYINDLGLNDCIILHGSKPYPELKQYLDECNIGVAFIPITSYYDHQPSTKIYEYALSGLYTIATSTYSNRCIINKENGILIQDDAMSFSKALSEIYGGRRMYDSEKIRSTMKDYTWSILVKNHLENLLESELPYINNSKKM